MNLRVTSLSIILAIWLAPVTAQEPSVSGSTGKTVRVAAISLVPQKLDLAGNAARLEKAFREAHAGGAKIAVAPEGALDGYIVNEIIAGELPAEKMNDVALRVDDSVVLRFRALAKELDLCLVFGFAERVGEDVFNSAVFIDNNGRVCGKYHKMQLAEGYDPSWWFNRLGKRSRAFDTPYGRCGILICNDRWNPSLARIPVLDGARFLIIPAFGSRSKSQDEAVLSRGTENNVPVIEANVGVSLVVDKKRIAAVDRRETGVTFSDITIPAPVAPNTAERDRVEREFLVWRETEMRRRLERRIARIAKKRAAVKEASQRPSFGAYYYPWYKKPKGSRLGWMSQALRGRLEPRQLPKLGVYDSRDPRVIAEHIAQSRRGAIDLWALSWWGPNSFTDVTIRDHILTHPDAGKLKYAILYESTGRLGKLERPNYAKLVPDFEYLEKTYFKHPSYLQIDGKPVVFVYLTRVYFRRRGGDALAQLRRRFPKLYLVGDEIFGPGYRERDAKLWDAVTAYDVYGQSLSRHGGTQVGIDVLAKSYSQAKKVANDVGAAFIPAISPGFNDRAVRKGHVGRARYLTDRKGSAEGDVFRQMIRQIAVPLADERAKRIVMVTSFNEWYEDTQIEATAGNQRETAKDDSAESGEHYTQGETYRDYGSLYLDILREALITTK
jgi:predicted amidohydrolase